MCLQICEDVFGFCAQNHLQSSQQQTTFLLIHCSRRIGRSAEFPEFPDWKAEGRVRRAGSQTGGADRKQPVSIFSLIRSSHLHPLHLLLLFAFSLLTD